MLESRSGPTRLLLLRCGKFDLAEVRLERSLHLVGPNNVGKTSLIALLQFLYIDDQRQMRFARDLAQTRRYYFPEHYSYALFECLTPTGFQVVAIHGLGPLKQFEFERFAYQGQIDRADFLVDRIPREPDDVRRQLAAKGYRKLEPKHLLGALTGLHDSRDINLGLVPARSAGTYDRFRRIFNNILRLAHLKQNELKQLLLEVHEGELKQKRIDLAGSYAESLAQVRKAAHELGELKSLQPDIEQTIAHARERDRIRKNLPGLWQALSERLEQARLKFEADRAKIDGLLRELAAGIERVKAERKQVASERDDTIRRQAELGDKLGKLERDKDRFRGKVAAWLQTQLADLQMRRDVIVATLGNRGTEPVEVVTARLAETDRDLTAMTARLQSVAQLAITEFRPLLPEADLRDLFTLLNPELLGAPLNCPGAPLRVPSPDETARRLQELLLGREGHALRIAGAELDLDGLPRPDLDGYSDPQTIQLRIARLAGSKERDQRILEAAREQARLEAEQAALAGEIDRCGRELHDLNAHERELALEDEWRKSLAQADRALAEADQRLEDLGTQEAQQADQSQALRRELEDKEKECSSLQGRVRGLEPPDPAWPFAEAVSPPRDLEDLIARYARLGRDHRQEAQAVAEGLARIEQRTYSRYRRETEEETLALLTEEFQSIPGKEAAVEELWKSLAVGIKSDLTGLGRDLDVLASLVAQVNRQMPGTTISNLRALRLIIQPVTRWRSLIGAIADTEKAPLFGDHEATGKALEQVGRILAENPAIELADMFNLHFEVEMPDGERRNYHHLDQFESNGTTIAVKVLVNLILLKRLLADAKVRIPFYLDECSSLDRDNLRAIVDTARELGFTAILASPEAMDVADRIYFMAEEENGRVILDPEASLVEIERTHGDGP